MDVFLFPLAGVKCEECSRGTATCSCNKCETVYCSACFERVMYVLVKFNSYFPFKLLAFKNPSPLEFLLTLLGVGRDIVWNCTFEIFKRIRQSQQ